MSLTLYRDGLLVYIPYKPYFNYDNIRYEDSKNLNRISSPNQNNETVLIFTST